MYDRDVGTHFKNYDVYTTFLGKSNLQNSARTDVQMVNHNQVYAALDSSFDYNLYLYLYMLPSVMT